MYVYIVLQYREFEGNLKKGPHYLHAKLNFGFIFLFLFGLDCMVWPGHVFLRFTPKVVFSLAFWNVYTLILSVDHFRLFVTHVTWPTVILRKSKPSFESERSCSLCGKVHCYPAPHPQSNLFLLQHQKHAKERPI